MNPDPAAVERLRKLAAIAGFPVTTPAATKVVAYLELMLAENRQVNLTAVREFDQALVLHACDSLAFTMTGICPDRALDLGSGNGFPGVAVATLCPQAEVTLLDRTRKKLEAIERCLAAAGLLGPTTRHADASQLATVAPELRQSYDLITVRAVATPVQLIKLARPLLRRDGRLLLWVSEATAAELDATKLGGVQRWKYELPSPTGEPGWQRRLLLAVSPASN